VVHAAAAIASSARPGPQHQQLACDALVQLLTLTSHRVSHAVQCAAVDCLVRHVGTMRHKRSCLHLTHSADCCPPSLVSLCAGCA
jgi:hypothetical protein